MQALVLERPGEPRTLKLTTLSVPEPGPEDIRVRVHAVGLNPVDYKLAAAGHPRWRYPFVLGLDVAGVVDAVGSEATHRWRVGDAVYYHGNLTRPGGFAEYAVTTAHTVARLPEGLSFAEAAALPCAAFTAYQAVVQKLSVRAEQTVLVHGGAGGVGGYAVQLAANLGARVLSTCSADNAEYVRALGAHEVIDYRTESLAQRVGALTHGLGVDGIVDTVSPASAAEGLELLSFFGGIACVAGLPDLRTLRPFTRAVSVHELALGAAHESGDRRAQEALAAVGREVGLLFGKGKLPARVERTLELSEVPQGLAQLATRHSRGKMVAVLRPD